MIEYEPSSRRESQLLGVSFSVLRRRYAYDDGIWERWWKSSHLLTILVSSITTKEERERPTRSESWRSGERAEPELCFIDETGTLRKRRVLWACGDVGSRCVRLRSILGEASGWGRSSFSLFCNVYVSLVVSCERAFEKWVERKTAVGSFSVFLVFLYSRHKPTSV